MNGVVICESLCFSGKALKRFDKTTVIETLAKFYHDDELVAAKSELCKCVQADAGATPTAPGIDGWSKFVNTKGAPIARRGNDPAQRRLLDAEDVVAMLTLLDANSVVLPTFVAADLDRVPGLYWCAGDVVSADVDKLSAAVDGILRRMTDMENKFDQRAMPSTTVDINTGHSAGHSAACEDVAAHASTGDLRPPADASANQTKKSFSSVAADVAMSKPTFNFKKMARGRRQADNCPIKTVPRELTCFVGRVHKDVTEEQLHDFLTGQGMKGVVCKKLIAKDGKIFSTSAFRVSCCTESADLFYDEALWPSGVELRDWVFYPKTNNGSTQ